MATNDNKLFNSKTHPIPPIRREIDIIPIKDNGSSYIYFHDAYGYATPNFALDSKVATVLNLFDGQKSIEDLAPYLGEEVSTDDLLKYVRFLDKNRLIRSEYFKNYSNDVEKTYEQREVHNPVAAGSSYPADPEELKKYLDEAFIEVGANQITKAEHAFGLLAPHIDPRVGMQSYVNAFAPVRDLKPQRVVILATSHYTGLYPETYKNKPFILSRKTFQMPFGPLEPDLEAIDMLLKYKEQAGLTEQDRAHRIEHSIELPLLFLNYLWDHPFRIVPILVGGFDDMFYMKEGHRGKQVQSFSERLQSLFGENENTFFLISGDLAHFGKKFGDSTPARELFNEVKDFDHHFLNYAAGGDEHNLFRLVQEKYDPYRICGFPPLYTFLKSFRNLTGEKLSYQLWDERERESAVTFGSILYKNAGKAD